MSDRAFFAAAEDGLYRWPMGASVGESGETIVTFSEREEIGDFRKCGKASLSPDGKWLAVAAESGDVGGERNLWLINLASEQLAAHRLPESAGAITCAISPGGRWLASGLLDSTRVCVWTMPEGDELPMQPVKSIPLQVNHAASVMFSPLTDPKTLKRAESAEWLITGDPENYQFWQTGSWELHEKKTIPSGMQRRSGRMAFSPRGTALAIAVDKDVLKVYFPPFPLPSVGSQEFSSPDFDTEIPICFSPSGRILVTAKPTGSIFFWKLDLVRTRLGEDWGLDWNIRKFDDGPGLPFAPDTLNHIILPSR